MEFPKLGPRLTVDISIGLDLADLHYSVRDIRGAPIARLTPLGWTCIGVVGNGIHASISMSFACTYLSTAMCWRHRKGQCIASKMLGNRY